MLEIIVTGIITGTRARLAGSQGLRMRNHHQKLTSPISEAAT